MVKVLAALAAVRAAHTLVMVGATAVLRGQLPTTLTIMVAAGEVRVGTLATGVMAGAVVTAMLVLAEALVVAVVGGINILLAEMAVELAY